MISGGCACGAVNYEGHAEPGFSFLCQCRPCQRMTGTGHAAAFVYPKDQLKLTGNLQSWARATDQGNTVTTHRCAICGTPIYNEPSVMPDGVMIAPGSLQDPTQFQPKRIVHQEEAQPWDLIHIPANAGDSSCPISHMT